MDELAFFLLKLFLHTAVRLPYIFLETIAQFETASQLICSTVSNRGNRVKNKRLSLIYRLG